MTRDLPILYLVDPSVAVTGASISARFDAIALKDHARIVFVFPKNSSIPQSELKEFWRVERLPMVSLSKRAHGLIWYLPTLLISAWKLHRMMKRDTSQHLILNDFYLMQGALLRLFGYRGHIATWIRCDPKRFAGPLSGPMLSLGHKSSNRMLAVSRYIQSLMPENYPTELLYEFYNGGTRAPRTWGKDEEKILMYIGNYIEGKGQDLALEAFAIAAGQDSTIRLDFYGDDMGLQKNRDFLKDLKMRAQKLGIADRVSFYGFIDNTFAALETSFAALNFSVSESFSRTVFEASGAGLPVIATMSGGPQEILEDEKTGYLIPVGDINAAADRIVRLAQNPALAAAMGEAGAAHIKANFAEDTFLKKLTNALGL